jgi:hypothetical protein
MRGNLFSSYKTSLLFQLLGMTKVRAALTSAAVTGDGQSRRLSLPERDACTSKKLADVDRKVLETLVEKPLQQRGRATQDKHPGRRLCRRPLAAPFGASGLRIAERAG